MSLGTLKLYERNTIGRLHGGIINMSLYHVPTLLHTKWLNPAPDTRTSRFKSLCGSASLAS